jgi:long-chain acyl-CoA synthetase
MAGAGCTRVSEPAILLWPCFRATCGKGICLASMAAIAFQPRPAEGLKYPNIVRMFEARLARSPHAPALRHKVAGVWRTVTWKQWWDEAREVAAGLIAAHGIEPGHTVAVLSPTRVEWIVADLAIALCGAISVPIYPSLTAAHVAFILRDSACRVVLADQLRRVEGVELHGTRVCVFETGSKDASTWAELRAAGAKAIAEGDADAELDRRVEATDLKTTLTHVYTSGTTGEPKGVVLTHENLVYEAWAIKNVVPVDETDEQLLVLPLAHIFARHLVWGAVEQGAVTAVGEGEPQIAANLLEVAPTFMGAVPRLYEMAHARVMREVIGRSPVTRRGFELALDVGRRLSTYKQRGQVPPTSLQLRAMVADRIFFTKIRGLFGGRLRFFVCGGAALNQEIAEFFHACGVLILEGYGLSETTGATNVNRPDRYRFGTVGPAMPGCEIRIAEDGEVLVRGHNVMRGYLNLPEETKATFDEHGWLRTGDIGELKDGFLRITDRKKSLFKTTIGKYVAPRMIEGRLRVKEGVGHVLVHGEGRPYPIALVSLDVEALLQRSDEEGLGCRTYADLAVHPRVHALIQEHIDAVNGTLARYEAVRRFAIVSQPFTVESGEVTPTRKLRRAVIAERHAALIDELYATEDGLHPAESHS